MIDGFLARTREPSSRIRDYARMGAAQ